jgi:tetratricopeptide (TPR) repeat protein
MRRNRTSLEQKIAVATTDSEKAIAYYNLGLFHDNNARETEAIPNYRKALQLGLDKETRARALAWLASSLYKTDQPQEAMQRIGESMEIADAELQRFLTRLKKRIQKVL